MTTDRRPQGLTFFLCAKSLVKEQESLMQKPSSEIGTSAIHNFYNLLL